MTELASPMFLGADASDSDTVSLHSTVASEEQEEYNVERIMLEQDLYDSDEGKAVTKYLGNVFLSRTCYVISREVKTNGPSEMGRLCFTTFDVRTS